MKEIKIKYKTPLGQGTQHTAYNYDKFKNKVIKTPNKNLEYIGNDQFKPTKSQGKTLDDTDIKLMVDNPDIFTKVYKATDRYAVFEKLNTKDFLRDAEYLINGVIKTFIENPDLAKFFTPKNPEFLTSSDLDGVADIYSNRSDSKFIREVYDNCGNKGKKFLLQLLKFMNTAIRKAGKKRTSGRIGLDFHARNLGYDKQGNIKMLDP